MPHPRSSSPRQFALALTRPAWLDWRQHEGQDDVAVTIRELLILTVTAGLAVGWWLDRSRILAEASRSRIELLREIHEARSALNEQVRTSLSLSRRLYDRREMATRDND